MICNINRLILRYSIVWSLTTAARAGAISAWWYSEAPSPQVIKYDISSGKIFYSLCNSNSTPVFPGNGTAAFDLDPNFPPMNGTSVAGTGYLLDGVNIAVIHYQEEKGGIVHSLWTCDATGHYFKGDGQGSWNISAEIGVPQVHPQTGLAVVNLGGDEQIGGFRVYFKDMLTRTRALRYTVYGGWAYDGFVTQDDLTSLDIAANFQTAKRLTVVTPCTRNYYGTLSIEVSTLTYTDSWEIDTFPSVLGAYNAKNDSIKLRRITNDTDTTQWTLSYSQDLPAWSLDSFEAKNANLALLVDSDTSQGIYYIGSDASLHGLTGYNTTWDKTPPEPNINWPPADEPNAPLALAYDSTHNETWIYYISNGSMVQVHQSDESTWEEAVTLLKFNSTSTEEISDTPSSGLSSGAKTGIGVGVGIGVPILIAAIAAYMFFHIKRSRASRDAERAAVEAAHADATSPPMDQMAYPSGVHPSMYGSPAPGYTSGYWEGGYWANGQWVPAATMGHSDQIYGKPEGDWRQSYGYYDNGHKSLSPQPAPQPVFELPHVERTHEMSGDGGIREMSAVESQPAQAPKPTEANNQSGS